jgi:hypothetical protein
MLMQRLAHSPRRAVRLEAVEARDAWLTLKSDDDAK